MPISLSEEIRKETTDDKNARILKCKFCNSVILTPSLGTLIEMEFSLPTVEQKVSAVTPNTESLDAFWLVDDMYKFYNVGFSNTVENIKYLTCGDCDAGPIGYHDITTKKSYVAFTRVVYS